MTSLHRTVKKMGVGSQSSAELGALAIATGKIYSRVDTECSTMLLVIRERKKRWIMSLYGRTHPRKIAETQEKPPAVAQNIRDKLRSSARANVLSCDCRRCFNIHIAVVDQNDQKNGQKHGKYRLNQGDSK